MVMVDPAPARSSARPLIQPIACQKSHTERNCVMFVTSTLIRDCDTSPVAELTVDGLQQACAQETRRYLNQQAHDPRFCLELLRRALTINDEQAWYAIYHHYQHQVCKWVQTSLAFAISKSELQTLVDDTFLKWHGTFRRNPQKFADYPNLAALLGLLRRCAERTVQDFVRKRQHETTTVLFDATDADDGGDRLPGAKRMLTNQELDHLNIQHNRRVDDEKTLALLQSWLRDEKEWLVATALFLEEQKPRELYNAYPHLFTSVNEVNTIRERLMARLRRNEQFRQQLHCLSEF